MRCFRTTSILGPSSADCKFESMLLESSSENTQNSDDEVESVMDRFTFFLAARIEAHFNLP